MSVGSSWPVKSVKNMFFHSLNNRKYTSLIGFSVENVELIFKNWFTLSMLSSLSIDA